MSIQPVVIQPGLVSGQMKTNDWRSGMCDCCDDMGICCCGFWCLPCLMCKTTSEFGECLCLPLLDPWFCMAVTCSVGMIPPIALSMRSTIRERYNIKGTICGDCCVVTCCNSCAWCQMARELKHHKQPLIISAPQAMPMGPSSGGYPQIQTQYGSPGPYNIMPQ